MIRSPVVGEVEDAGLAEQVVRVPVEVEARQKEYTDHSEILAGGVEAKRRPVPE